MIEAKFIEYVAQLVHASPDQVAKAAALFDSGATIPFVAQYRKDVTGNLSERQLERIGDQNTYFISLTDRRNAIMHALEAEGKIGDGLRDQFMACMDKHTLEDLYLSFKKKGHLKASQAREKGLEPLAEFLWNQAHADKSIEEVAASYMNADRGVESVDAALEGARHILAERIAHDPDIRGMIRDGLLGGQLSTQATKNADNKKTKFEAFYNFSEPLAKVRSHRLLTILRGVRKGFLRMELAVDDEGLKHHVERHLLKDAGSPYEPYVRAVVDDAYRRHLRPALENDVMAMVREDAEREAIELLRESLAGILMAASAGPIPTIGIQPAADACVVVVIDETGQLINSATIHPLPPQEQPEASLATLRELAAAHAVKAFAIANCTGSRDIARLVDRIVQEQSDKGLFSLFVNDAAARAYADSKVAVDELPGLDTLTRSAVSIARRLQDPLRELVKVEPRSLGIGQYQYDIPPKALRDAFTQTVISCVNRVGVDLNTADTNLLRYVSGIQFSTAENIVRRRAEHGAFTNRNELIEVNGIGPKVFEQAAGFVRVCGGDQALDATPIHPESYPIVEQWAQELGLTVSQLSENTAALSGLELAKYTTDVVAERSLEDIRTWLKAPRFDPRPAFRVPSHKQIHGMEDLETGMDMEGVVTNVTDFGAFVDIGAYHDGLIHLSELANHFIRDPREIVSVGEVIKVRVIGVDLDHKRISLSRKALIPSPARNPRRGERDKKSVEGHSVAPAVVHPPAREGNTPTPRTGDGAERPQRPQQPRRGKDRKRQTRPPQPAPTREKKEESLNTLLADQLLALRDKFKP